MPEEYTVKSPLQLRDLYPPTLDRAARKVLPSLDSHCRHFLSLSPFLCLATSGPTGADLSPRGDSPGFVRILSDSSIAIPDWPGNNRLDSLTNILHNPAVALLVLIPGFDETLRINGTASITTDPSILALWNVNSKQPRTAILVSIHEAFLHCGKAFLRSRLWDPAAQIPRDTLPSYGRMMKDQITIADSVESIEASIADSYSNKLY